MRGDPECWAERGLGGDVGHGATTGVGLSLGVPSSGSLPLPLNRNEIAAVSSSVLVSPSTGATGQVRTAAGLNPGNLGLV